MEFVPTSVVVVPIINHLGKPHFHIIHLILLRGTNRFLQLHHFPLEATIHLRTNAVAIVIESLICQATSSIDQRCLQSHEEAVAGFVVDFDETSVLYLTIDQFNCFTTFL